MPFIKTSDLSQFGYFIAGHASSQVINQNNLSGSGLSSFQFENLPTGGDTSGCTVFVVFFSEKEIVESIYEYGTDVVLFAGESIDVRIALQYGWVTDGCSGSLRKFSKRAFLQLPNFGSFVLGELSNTCQLPLEIKYPMVILGFRVSLMTGPDYRIDLFLNADMWCRDLDTNFSYYSMFLYNTTLDSAGTPTLTRVESVYNSKNADRLTLIYGGSSAFGYLNREGLYNYLVGLYEEASSGGGSSGGSGGESGSSEGGQIILDYNVIRKTVGDENDVFSFRRLFRKRRED